MTFVQIYMCPPVLWPWSRMTQHLCMNVLEAIYLPLTSGVSLYKYHPIQYKMRWKFIFWKLSCLLNLCGRYGCNKEIQ